MAEKLRILLANALAGSLDLSMGALIAAATLSSFGIQPTLWHLAVGSILGALPDFDILLPILLIKEPEGNHHTTLLHRPILIIPAAALAAYLVGGQAWSLVAFLCVSWHYLHDTPPMNINGVAWLWPFDHRHWSPWGPVSRDIATTHNAWLKKYWLRPSPLSCMEVGAGLMALTLALLIALRTV